MPRTPSEDRQPALSARRAALLKARESKRPSRHGLRAGTSTADRSLDGSGFPRLLTETLRRARTADSVTGALEQLFTLSGHVSEAISRSALTGQERTALEILSKEVDGRDEPAFIGFLGITETGRTVVATPQRPRIEHHDRLLGVAKRIPWTVAQLEEYTKAFEPVRDAEAYEAETCRRWLSEKTPEEVEEILAEIAESNAVTAPMMLYRDLSFYTNHREQNNLPGKTLWEFSNESLFNHINGLPIRHWTADDVVFISCYWLLLKSGGHFRIEELNGGQLSLHRVADLLEKKQRLYGHTAPREIDPDPWALESTGARIAEQRLRSLSRHLHYREIHGPLLHKTEKIATPTRHSREREGQILERLASTFPLKGTSLTEAAEGISRDPLWLVEPSKDFKLGFEHLVHDTVRAVRDHCAADMAMSRGKRSMGSLVDALTREDWETICGWELPEFYCCVLPAPSALDRFGGSRAALADSIWAISARMQFNCWHHMAGNLPKVPAVLERDRFSPPTMPDIAYFSDHHHRGHTANQVRFTIRSPQAVTVAGLQFNGFTDVRLLRYDDLPFTEEDMIVTDRVSSFLASVKQTLATMAQETEPPRVEAFDHTWHRWWIETNLVSGKPW